MKVALFRNIKHDFVSVSDLDLCRNDDYIRESEWVEVEFPPLSSEEMAAKKIGILESMKKDLQAKTQQRLNEIDRQIAELQALPQPA